VNEKKVFTTSVRKNAGKFAEWNESYDLDFKSFSSERGQLIFMKAYDKDPLRNDYIGKTEPIPYY